MLLLVIFDLWYNKVVDYQVDMWYNKFDLLILHQVDMWYNEIVKNMSNNHQKVEPQ